MSKKPLVINLIGGPGCGKSTTAAGLFYVLKTKGYNCEMALEFAKDKVYEESFRTMDDQLYIFGKQYHRLWRLRDKVDIIITDSPLLVSIYYNKTKSDFFEDLVVEQFDKFENFTIMLNRENVEFHQEGRIQNEEESKAIDKEMMSICEKHNIPYVILHTENAVNGIVEMVDAYMQHKND